MKKLALLMFVLLALTSVCAFGQASQWVVGVKAHGGVPTGDFNTVSSFGIGGTVYGGYMVDPNVTITLRSGYLRFSGKDFSTSVQGIAVTSKTSFGIIPITAGMRYYFMPGDTRVYGALEAGLYLLNVSTDITGGTFTASATNSTSKFGVNPMLGVQFKAGDKMNVDLHGAYSMVFTDVSNTSWIDFGLGLEWMLQ